VRNFSIDELAITESLKEKEHANKQWINPTAVVGSVMLHMRPDYTGTQQIGSLESSGELCRKKLGTTVALNGVNTFFSSH
jgi:hypothetical protein